MKAVVTLIVAFSFAVSLHAQTSQRSEPTPAAEKQQAAKKNAPTLGFTHIKDVSPVTDEDAYMEELKLEKQLPGNEFVQFFT
jgi:hypothetical protein